LYKFDFKCNECQLSYRDFYIEAYRKIRNKRYFKFPKMKTRRVDYLIRAFRKSLPKDSRLEIDHIIPVSMGGQTLGFENLQILCSKCHKNKTSKDKKAKWEKFGSPIKGVKFTEAHIEALSRVRRGFDSSNRRAHREKMYERMRVPIVALNLKTKEETEFTSSAEASRVLKLQECNISRVLNEKQGRKQHKGWKFRYK
jgi:hypothetical protein